MPQESLGRDRVSPASQSSQCGPSVNLMNLQNGVMTVPSRGSPTLDVGAATRRAGHTKGLVASCLAGRMNLVAIHPVVATPVNRLGTSSFAVTELQPH